MLLLIDTWSEACCWFSNCTNCSIVRCDSASRCSIHVNARAKAALCPCKRRANSATNALPIGGVRSRHVGDDEDEAFRILLGDLHHLVGPAIGQIALGPAGGNAHSDAAKILDQGEPQHDRDGPKLAKLQHGNRLVGGDEAAQAISVDPAIAVRDRLERDVVHARHARPTDRAPIEAAPGCSRAANAAWQCESALRSDGSCRLATRQPE